MNGKSMSSFTLEFAGVDKKSEDDYGILGWRGRGEGGGAVPIHEGLEKTPTT